MRIPQWFLLVWVVVIAVAAVGLSAASYMFVRDRAAELDTILELPDPPQVNRPVSGSTNATPVPDVAPTTVADAANPDSTAPDGPSTPDVSVQPGDTSAQPAASGETYTAWNDPRRVSVLLLGIDQRAGETGTFPTDTIMLLSIDPIGKTAALLSIPRDLWVELPGLGRADRINTANIVGDDISYPGGGGPAYAVKTVERELGLKIQYYVLINFEVFTRLIDAVGPVEVCPPAPIDDDHYPDGSYGYLTIHFDAGCQELGAERLLQYARTRHQDSDIGRAQRQQEVILAVRKKVLSAGGVAALLPEAPGLWQSVQDNIRTNLSFENMVSLALRAEQIPADNIRQGQISFGEVYASTTPSGDEILVPISSDILQLIEDLFRPAGTPSSRPSN